MKLIWREPESDALQTFLAKWPETPLVSSALLLRNDLDALGTYDQRLAVAATGEGLPVQAPGA